MKAGHFFFVQNTKESWIVFWDSSVQVYYWQSDLLLIWSCYIYQNAIFSLSVNISDVKVKISGSLYEGVSGSVTGTQFTIGIVYKKQFVNNLIIKCYLQLIDLTINVSQVKCIIFLFGIFQGKSQPCDLSVLLFTEDNYDH